MQVKKQQLELDMEQRTGSKLGKEYVKAVYCHCIFLLHLLHSPATKEGRHMEEKMPGARRDTYTTAICR